MSNQQILEKAVQKAIKNGWSWAVNERPIDSYGDLQGVKWLLGTESYKLFIFNHDFAKAVFGEEYIKYIDGREMPAWMLHLKEMVVAEDPLDYLKDNI